MTSRFLITTADETSWKTDRPVVFLGEWCRGIEREHVWTAMDAVLARPVWSHGLARAQVIEEVERLSGELLLELTGALNRLHHMQRSVRFWRILLGHWIHRYTCALFHRWHAVRQVLEDYTLSGTILLQSPSFHLAVADTGSFTWACNDAFWNNNLIGRVLRKQARPEFEFETVCVVRAQAAAAPAGAPGARDRRGLVDGMLALLQRDDDAFVISSYLPKRQAMALSIRLGHIPQRRASPAVQPVAVDTALRAQFRLPPGSRDGFAGFARDLLPEMLPTCYLEGFESLSRQVEATGWPRSPRLVFTSNAFDTCEVFKLWAADKAEGGAPYVTGQHGNNYGSARYCPSEQECVATSDAFVTWGWRDEGANYQPAFIFKTAGDVQGAWDPNGGLLLIEVCLPHRLLAWDPYPEFATYQEEQFQFVADLPTQIRQQTTVRLHAEYRKQPWGEEERWRRQRAGVTLDDGTTAVAKLIAASRLIVHSYDSTGILETLALNIPTLCFWNGGLEHVRDSAVPFYEMLSAAGILHHSPESAAHKVAEVWGDVGSWWASSVVQEARRKFCEQYARPSAAPAAELASLLVRIGGMKADARR